MYLYPYSKSLEVGRVTGRGLSNGVHTDGVLISMDHMLKALDQLRSSHSDAIGAPKVIQP